MKKILITNGILSIITSIGLIIYIVGVVKAMNTVLNNNDTKIMLEILKSTTSLTFWGMVILVLGSIPSLVMGIITLTKSGTAINRGLTMASGILGIIGGVFFAGTIVSFIAAYKED